MNIFTLLTSFIFMFSNIGKVNGQDCITFAIGDGTGCQFMCDYCSENLGTTKFYFTDWICQNKNGMCTGEPIPWETYTCCTDE